MFSVLDSEFHGRVGGGGGGVGCGLTIASE